MGLADRDDMRSERQDEHFFNRRGEPPRTSKLAIVLFLLGTGFAGGPRPAVAQAEQPTPAPAPAPESPHVQKKQLCDYLDEQIKWIDAMARQPQSGRKQDWLSARRKEARDEQFRIRC